MTDAETADSHQSPPVPLSRLNRWARFGLGGALNTAVAIVVYWLLRRLVNYQVAYFVGYIAGIVFGYWFQSSRVFRTAMSVRGLLVFPSVYVVQYVTSATVLYVLVKSFDVHADFAPVLVAVMTLPVTYLASRTVLTRSSRRQAEAAAVRQAAPQEGRSLP